MAGENLDTSADSNPRAGGTPHKETEREREREMEGGREKGRASSVGDRMRWKERKG
jgi:hypothetical protein